MNLEVEAHSGDFHHWFHGIRKIHGRPPCWLRRSVGVLRISMTTSSVLNIERVSDIFLHLGEEAFRRIEHDAIVDRVRSIRRGEPTCSRSEAEPLRREQNIELLRENGITIWIDTDFDIMRKRVQSSDHRPLARNRNVRAPVSRAKEILRASRISCTRSRQRFPCRSG